MRKTFLTIASLSFLWVALLAFPGQSTGKAAGVWDFLDHDLDQISMALDSVDIVLVAPSPEALPTNGVADLRREATRILGVSAVGSVTADIHHLRLFPEVTIPVGWLGA